MAAPLVGRRVLIKGLGARPELNGLSGLAESFKPDTGRYVVELNSGEVIAVRPQCVEAVPDTGNYDQPGGNYFQGAGMGGLPGQGLDPKLVLAGTAVVLIYVVGVQVLSAVALVAVGYVGYMAFNAPVGGGRPLERICFALQQSTGMMVTPQHLMMAGAAVMGLIWYFYFGPGSYNHYGGGMGGHRSGYSSYGAGGGYDFYWFFGAAMLASYVYRMGGGGRPEGWSFDQFWHSLSNIDFWQGLMLMNLIQRVLGGGGRRRMYY